MGGKSSKNSWNTPQEPIQEASPQRMPNSEMYESSIKWQPPENVQNDLPIYINQHQRDVPNGTPYESSSLYYNQSQVSARPTNHSFENSYANPVLTTVEKSSKPTKEKQKMPPKERAKKSPKTKDKKEKKDPSILPSESTESPPVNSFPEIHFPKANFDREWFIAQLQEKKHLQESVYEVFPGGDEGRISYGKEDANINKAKQRSDSNAISYTNKEKARRPLLYQSETLQDNASPVKSSRGNSQSGVDSHSAKNPSKESENLNPIPTTLVQVLPSEPYEIRNLKHHRGHRGSPRNNNNFIPDPDYNEDRNSNWDFDHPSVEGRWMPEIDY